MRYMITENETGEVQPPHPGASPVHMAMSGSIVYILWSFGQSDSFKPLFDDVEKMRARNTELVNEANRAANAAERLRDEYEPELVLPWEDDDE